MLSYPSIQTRKKTLNCRGRLINLEGGKVMGILNVTPDSFYDGGRHSVKDAQMHQVERMLKAGAAFIDVGGYSSRPGADDIGADEELKRVLPVVEMIHTHFPEAIISIDTFRAEVAGQALQAGAHIINDITAGSGDAMMFETVAKWKAPYIIMHMQGTPRTMQIEPRYDDVAGEILQFFSGKLEKLREINVVDVIIDPGFGFGKNLEHNYELLRKLHLFSMLEQPVMVGVSRKSMINKLLHTKPENALNGTSIVNTLAILQGCDILRVHDVKEAVQALRVVNYYRG